MLQSVGCHQRLRLQCAAESIDLDSDDDWPRYSRRRTFAIAHDLDRSPELNGTVFWFDLSAFVRKGQFLPRP